MTEQPAKVMPRRIELNEAVRSVSVRLVQNGAVLEETKQPVLVGKCHCGSSVAVPISGREDRAMWMQGERIELHCPRCRAPLWSQRQMVKVASMAEVPPLRLGRA